MTSGKVMVLGLVGLVLAAGGLLLWATSTVHGDDAASRARLPRPIAAAALPPGPGAELVQRHCTGCHAIPDPAQHPAAAWPGVLADMERRIHSRIMRGAPMPSREDWNAMEEYLQAHAADAAGLASDGAAR